MNDSANQNHHGESGGHEPIPISRGGVVASGIALAALVVVVMILMRFLSAYLSMADGPATSSDRQDSASAAPRLAPLASEPPLSTKPSIDLHTLRAAENETLDTYGWIDREAGIARIPIERAVAILAENGLRSAAPTEQEN